MSRRETTRLDCASRGMHPRDLLQHELWWRGPEWLPKPLAEWPAVPDVDDPRSAEEEARKAVAHVATTPPPSPLDPLPYTISSWPRLLRITARVLRALRRWGRGAADNGDSRVPELREARTWWLRWLQGYGLRRGYRRDSTRETRPAVEPPVSTGSLRG